MSSAELVIKIMKSRVWPDHAATMHAELAGALRMAGFYVTMEYPTAHLGDRRDGRIDIVAFALADRIAIELDCRKPRRRSLEKLRLFDGYKIVGVRGIEGHETPDGIDAVIPMRVRVAKKSEKSDRRTVNRRAA